MSGNKFDFRNLNVEIRRLMVLEIEDDIAAEVLNRSKVFNEAGISCYPKLLVEAVLNFDEVWLGNMLRAHGAFREIDDKGNKVPFDAHERFAQGEFNRFYIRAVCRHAVANPTLKVVVYRARFSKRPREDSERLIGTVMDPVVLLGDLRLKIGTQPEYCLPLIRSGLSVEIVADAEA